jgi:hypothetical protein
VFPRSRVTLRVRFTFQTDPWAPFQRRATCHDRFLDLSGDLAAGQGVIDTRAALPVGYAAAIAARRRRIREGLAVAKPRRHKMNRPPKAATLVVEEVQTGPRMNERRFRATSSCARVDRTPS